MSKHSETHMVWLDMEMTGLDPDKNGLDHDRIIEIACVVTDSELNVIAEGPSVIVKQPDHLLCAPHMDNWNVGTHGKKGSDGLSLIDKVKASVISESQAEEAMLAFLRPIIPKGAVPLCGNSIHQDRRFMTRYMPALEAFFHYRNLDVSTLKELAKRWRPDVYKSFKKAQKHTALADVYESIEELKHYRLHLMPNTFPATLSSTILAA